MGYGGLTYNSEFPDAKIWDLNPDQDHRSHVVGRCRHLRKFKQYEFG